MKFFATGMFFVTLSLSIHARVEVIYGNDNRQDIYQIKDAKIKEYARSTAGLIKKDLFNTNPLKTISSILRAETLSASQNICMTEAFANQLTAPICSGFLVAPDVLITAGHCYNAFTSPENVCKDFAWVFDYNMNSPTDNPTINISPDRVFNCKKVLSLVRDQNHDFAIIKLDRVAQGRKPLSFRKSGKIPDNAQLIMIGHPTGLPTKIDATGKITYNQDTTRFSTNLDSFHGNSGSAVLNAKTGQIEGILIMGKTDYVPQDKSNPTSCQITNKCDDNARNCTFDDGSDSIIGRGEVVLRITELSPLITSTLKLSR